MKRIIQIVLFVMLTSNNVVLSQIQVQNYNAASDPIANLVNALGGNTTNIFNVQSNIVLNKDSLIGTFNDPTSSILGLSKKGVILGTGYLHKILGSSSRFVSDQCGLPGDANLDAYVNGTNPTNPTPTFDAVVLEFDFIPYNDTISFNYSFGSEEYPEYVGSRYNDIFAFEILGNEYPVYNNIALIPNTNTPVAINNVNAVSNASYFINNENVASPFFNTITMDGLTKGLVAKAKVTPCKTYHLRLSIADVGDQQYDSYVFIGGLELGDNYTKVITGDTTVCVGLDAKLKYTANASVINPKWQKLNTANNAWEYLKNDSTYSGVNDENLTIKNALSSYDGNQYRVEINNTACGFVYSNVANFKVFSNNISFSNPVPIDQCYNQNSNNFTFNSTPSLPASASLSYNWQVKVAGSNSFVNLTNSSFYNDVSTNMLRINNIDSTFDGNAYRLASIDKAGRGCYYGQSAPADLKIRPFPQPPSILPIDSICLNGTAPDLNKYVSGVNLKWFSVATGGQALNSMPLASSTTTGIYRYWISQTRNGCESNRAPLKYTVLPLPVVKATASAPIICEGNTSILKGSGALAYQWNHGVIDGNPFDPSSTKIYTVIGSDAKGCKQSDSITIKVNTKPNVKLPADTTVCESLNSIDINAKIANQDSYLWSSQGGSFSSSNPTSRYTFSAADKLALKTTIALTANKAFCEPARDSITIFFEKQAAISASDQVVCENQASINLLANVNNANNTIWTTKNGKGLIAYNGKDGINYSLSASDTSLTNINFLVITDGQVKCVPDSTELVITLIDKPFVKASNFAICENENDTLLTLLAKNVTDVLWKIVDGKGSFNTIDMLHAKYKPSSEDTIKNMALIEVASVNNAVCAIVKDTFKISVISKPVLEITDQLICNNFKETPIVINTKHTNGIQWTNLNATGKMSNIPYYYAKGSGDSLLQFINILATSINSSVCKSEQDTLTIEFIATPLLSLEDQKCEQSNLILDPKAQFNWTQNYNTNIIWEKNGVLFNNGSATVMSIGVGKYTVKFLYPGCTVTDSILILPLPNILTNDYVICEGKTDSIGVNFIKNANYTWSDGLMGFQLNKRPITAGSVISSYEVTVSDSNQCQSTSSFLVNYTNRPKFDLISKNYCKDSQGSAQVMIKSLTNNPITYKWQYANINLNQNLSSIDVSRPGKYVVIVAYGDCEAKDSTIINEYPLPNIGMERQYIHCVDNPNPVNIAAIDGYKYNWNNSIVDTNQSLSVYPLIDSWYSVKLTNAWGCHKVDSAFVKISCPPRVFSPNVITPDKNDENKYLKVFGDHYKNLELYVYNRWGEVIFKSIDDINGWDGTYAGELVPIGTYPYTIKYEGKYEDYPGPYKIESKVTVIR